MTQTASKRVEKVEPGDIIWLNGGGKRVVRVERLPDFPAYYGSQRRWRVEFADGTSATNSNSYDEVLVAVPDCVRKEAS